MCPCNSKGCHHLWLGLVAFVIGAVFLLQKFDVVPETTWGWLWPSILVVMGLKFMLAGCYSSSCCEEDSCKTECCMPCEEKPKTMKKPAKKKAKRKSKK